LWRACGQTQHLVQETPFFGDVFVGGVGDVWTNVEDTVDIFKPDLCVARASDIEISWLRERGIRGVVLDLDNTTCAYGQDELASGVLEWVGGVRASGIAVVLVSNNFSARVDVIGTRLGILGVASALKPLPFGFLRALRMLATRSHETVMVGDQLLTDVLGAKLLGLQTVLTEPLVAKDFPLTRLLRLIERVIFGRMLS
jgi:uncharacterized protein